MRSEEIGRELKRNFGRRYVRGLRTSARNNASAYGFSLTITSTVAILSSTQGMPDAPEVFALAGGAIVAFAFVEGSVSHGFRRRLEDESSRVKALGSSISVFSVGTALVLVLAIERLLHGDFLVWPLASFVATVSYLFIFALELSAAEWFKLRHQERE